MKKSQHGTKTNQRKNECNNLKILNKSINIGKLIYLEFEKVYFLAFEELHNISAPTLLFQS